MSNDHRQFIGGAWSTALGTSASRVLGLLRDIATASLLGLGESGVMDALVVAVRVPNLFRRLFGEGALTAAFLPAFAGERLRSVNDGWKLVSAVLVWLTGVLTLIVLAAEALLGIAWFFARDNPAVSLLLEMVAANLPYVVTICVASLLAATLQAVGQFTIPAMAPALLNICWLAGAWFVAPYFAPDKVAQAWVIVVSIQIAGVLQAAVQWPALRAAGFRFQFDWPASRDTTRKIGRAVAVVALGLTITQINTLLDSLIAWIFSAPPGGSSRIEWFGGVAYPMQVGAASAIHYGERFYQLPLGILGLAIATAIFPLLSRHAAKGDKQLLGSDLTLGLRLALFTSVPAGVGLVLIAEPLSRLLYQHGAFTSDDAHRTARMILAYSSAVWAFCAVPVVVRGFYAHGDQLTPVRIGLASMVINLLLDLTLIWWVGEIALALSTAAAAVLQLALLLAAFQLRYGSLNWSDLGRCAMRTTVATLAMTVVVFLLLARTTGTTDWLSLATRLTAATVGGTVVYAVVASLLRSPEIALLTRGSTPRSPSDKGETA